MFLDPINDCPDKLIWALIGWLAFANRPETYRTSLTELREILDYTFENMPPEEESKET